MKIQVDRKGEVFSGYKAERARGLFNVSEEDGSEFHLTAELPVELDSWKVGVVVGSSGSGKSSIGQELEKEGYYGWTSTGKRWKSKPILEEIEGNFDEVTGVLTTVGLGSVPAWLRPYSVLSNGEKFRADSARLLRSKHSAVVVDEFTSVLDRTVACTGSAAFVRAWRKRGGQVVLLTCHHDILDWLEPDWVFDTDDAKLYTTWAEQTGLKGDYPEVGLLVVKK